MVFRKKVETAAALHERIAQSHRLRDLISELREISSALHLGFDIVFQALLQVRPGVGHNKLGLVSGALPSMSCCTYRAQYMPTSASAPAAPSSDAPSLMHPLLYYVVWVGAPLCHARYCLPNALPFVGAPRAHTPPTLVYVAPMWTSTPLLHMGVLIA